VLITFTYKCLNNFTFSFRLPSLSLSTFYHLTVATQDMFCQTGQASSIQTPTRQPGFINIAPGTSLSIAITWFNLKALTNGYTERWPGHRYSGKGTDMTSMLQDFELRAGSDNDGDVSRSGVRVGVGVELIKGRSITVSYLLLTSSLATTTLNCLR
jgi:hypothetical protein